MKCIMSFEASMAELFSLGRQEDITLRLIFDEQNVADLSASDHVHCVDTKFITTAFDRDNDTQ